MAVSKSLRFQIFRRDNHTCRYCGATAPDAALRIDHVVPTTLGGSDDPSNLVAACQDCNSGKSATPADAALVADVAQDAMRWARAMEVAADEAQDRLHERNAARIAFDIEWIRWHTPNGNAYPRDEGWERSVDRWIGLGLTSDDLEECIGIAMRSRAGYSEKWRYFCGVTWKLLTERQAAARNILTVGDAPAAPAEKYACGNHPPITGEVVYAAYNYLSLADVCDGERD